MEKRATKKIGISEKRETSRENSRVSCARMYFEPVLYYQSYDRPAHQLELSSEDGCAAS